MKRYDKSNTALLVFHIDCRKNMFDMGSPPKVMQKHFICALMMKHRMGRKNYPLTPSRCMFRSPFPDQFHINEVFDAIKAVYTFMIDS